MGIFEYAAPKPKPKKVRTVKSMSVYGDDEQIYRPRPVMKNGVLTVTTSCEWVYIGAGCIMTNCDFTLSEDTIGELDSNRCPGCGRPIDYN